MRRNFAKPLRTSRLKIKDFLLDFHRFSYGFKDFKSKTFGFWKNLAKTLRTCSLKINDPLVKVRVFFLFFNGFKDFKSKNCGFGKNLTKTTSSLKINDKLFKIRRFFLDSSQNIMDFKEFGQHIKYLKSKSHRPPFQNSWIFFRIQGFWA